MWWLWIIPPPPWLAVVAQTTADDWASLVERLGVGFVVAVVAGLALRRVYNEKAELERSIREQAIPALLSATEALHAVHDNSELEASVREALRDVTRLMERIERRLDDR